MRHAWGVVAGTAVGLLVVASAAMAQNPPAPAINSVAPNSGPVSGGTVVTITGSGFKPNGANASTVSIGGITCVVLSAPDDMTIVVRAPQSGGVVGPRDVTVTNNNGQSDTLLGGYSYIGAPPDVSSVLPSSGPNTGGTLVTLVGDNFYPGVTVTFGSIPALNVTRVTSLRITCTTPDVSPVVGSLAVTVTNLDGQSDTSGNAFNAVGPTPTLTAVAPVSGSTFGGTVATLTGTNFAPGPHVYFGSSEAHTVVVQSSTTLTCVTPPGPADTTVQVEILNRDGQSAILAGAYTFLRPPIISSIAPAGGTIAGGTVVTITGLRFRSGATVTFDGVAATSVTVVSATQIVATTPAGTIGRADVTVTDSVPLSDTLVDGFLYLGNPPSITSVSPPNGHPSGGNSVTITGTNFYAGATVRWGGAQLALTSLSSTEAVVVAPPHASGNVEIVLRNVDGQSATSSYLYNFPPNINALTPNNGAPAGGNSVTIAGSSFASGITVTFGGSTASVTSQTASQVVVTVPAGSIGTVTVVVTNPDGQADTASYTYNPAPAIASLSPASGSVAGGFPVEIEGSGFSFGCTVDFGGTQATLGSRTPLCVFATAPAAPAGTVTLTLTNPDGQQATANFTYVNTHTITGVTPGSGFTTGGNAVTIAGTGFVTGSTVTFGGVTAPTTFVTSYRLVATAPPGSAGTAAVVVTNPGPVTASASYQYVAGPGTVLSIVGVTPAFGAAAGGTTATIAGTNFASGASVTFGSAAAAVSSVSATQIVATIPAGSVGTALVTVTNPDGQQATTSFTYYPPPSITGISPGAGPTAGGNRVTITGSDFLRVAALIPTVTFGSTVASTLTVQPTTIVAIAPAGSGSVNVTITNPDGQSSSSSYQYVAAPIISSVSPTNGPATGGNTITIDGVAFATGATVTLDGNAATVLTSSDVRITVTAPAGSAGKAKLVVTNPDRRFDRADYFYNPPPMITSISPTSGSFSGGTTFTIAGSNFMPGAIVAIGNAVDLLSFTATQIVGVTRDQVGTKSVVITNPDGQQATLSNAYTYDTSMGLGGPAPSSGPQAGGNAVTLHGNGFQSGATVTFGANSATINSITATQIAVTVPASATAGTVMVTVTNPGGAASVDFYTYRALALTSVSPAGWSTAGGNAVTITGDGFAAGATVTFGSTPATVTFLSLTRINVTAPPGTAGVATVTVTNVDGSTANGAYTYAAPPLVTAVSPGSGPNAGGNAVTLSGSGFSSGSTVTFGVLAAAVASQTATQLVVTAPEGPGPVTIAVRNPDGQATTASYVYETAPMVAAIVPGSGPASGGATVTITGAGFATGATVTVGGVAASSVAVVSAAQLTAVTPTVAPAIGPQDVVVTNPTGLAGMLPSGFVATGSAPTISTVSPNSGPIAGGTPITISGFGFAPGAWVRIGGRRADRLVVVNSTTATCLSPLARATGTVSVVLGNPDGQTATATGAYAYVAGAAIAAVTPAAGPAGGGTTVSITGSGFASGSTVAIGGIPASFVTVVSSTLITAVTPSGAAGAADVEVTGPSASPTTALGAYTYLAAGAPGIATTLGLAPRLRNNESIRFTVTVTDPEGDPVSLRLLNPPPGCTMSPVVNQASPATASVYWRLRPTWGLQWLAIEARDNRSPANVATLRIPVQVLGARLGQSQGTVLADVTGDGRDDLIAIATSADEGLADNGAVYVWAGATTPLSTPTATLRVAGLPDPAIRDVLGQGALQVADVTGDGVLDIVVVSALKDRTNGGGDVGEIFVFAGGALSGVQGQIARLWVPGAVSSDRLGASGGTGSSVILEDINGDGVRDIVASARVADVAGVVNAGAIYLWNGGTSLAGSRPPDAELTVPGAVTDAALGTSFGQGVQCFDVTGDGRPDIVAGAPAARAPNGATKAGAIYIWDTAGVLAGRVSPTATLYVGGATNDSALGSTTGLAIQFQDVDDDGYADIVSGFPLTLGIGFPRAGAMFVWAGGPGPRGATTELARLEVGVSNSDAGVGNMSGQGVLLRDVTGDGVVDVVAGTTTGDTATASNAGQVFVWAGGQGLAGTISPTARLEDPSAVGGDQMGSASGVALFCEDVSGDGIADVVVPGTGIDGARGPGAGAVHIWVGGSGVTGTVGPTATLQYSTPAGDGPIGFAYAGDATVLADVTGDGITDVVIAAGGYDLPRTDAGAVFVWAGGTGLTGTPSETAALLLSTTSVNERLTDVSGQGLHVADVTGDGILDILAGSRRMDGCFTDAGGVVLWVGGTGLTGTLTPAATTRGAPLGGQLTSTSGEAVQFIDVTGNGVLDLLVGGSGTGTGGAILVFAGGSGLAGEMAPSATLQHPDAKSSDALGSGAGDCILVCDLDGDGVPEILGVATGADRNGKVDTGAIFRWIGGAALTAAPTPWTHWVPWASPGDGLGG